MLQVGGKAVALLQLLRHGGKDTLIYLDPFAAVAAEEMMVVRVAVNFVLNTAAPEIGRVNEIESSQKVESAIDARFVDWSIA